MIPWWNWDFRKSYARIYRQKIAHSKLASSHSLTSGTQISCLCHRPHVASQGLNASSIWMSKQFSASQKDVTFLRMILLCKFYYMHGQQLRRGQIDWDCEPKNILQSTDPSTGDKPILVFIWEWEVFSFSRLLVFHIVRHSIIVPAFGDQQILFFWRFLCLSCRNAHLC